MTDIIKMTTSNIINCQSMTSNFFQVFKQQDVFRELNMTKLTIYPANYVNHDLIYKLTKWLVHLLMYFYLKLQINSKYI